MFYNGVSETNKYTFNNIQRAHELKIKVFNLSALLLWKDRLAKKDQFSVDCSYLLRQKLNYSY